MTSQLIPCLPISVECIVHSPDAFKGSFIEFLPLLERLRERYKPNDLPYHLVVPSLPGYTFSSPPPLDRDFRVEDIARLFDRLATSLGFENGYVVQGGDVGSKVARVMAAEHASCKGQKVYTSCSRDLQLTPGSLQLYIVSISARAYRS